MHTQHSTTSLFYHPLHRLQYKLKHGINGTTKRNNNHIEDKKAPNIKQKSVQAKQTDCMMYTHHLQLGLGMICGTVPCIQIQSLFFTTYIQYYGIQIVMCILFLFSGTCVSCLSDKHSLVSIMSTVPLTWICYNTYQYRYCT